MKNKLRKINKGIVLLFLLVVTVGTIGFIDTVKFSARKEDARQKAESFVTELSAFYVWPKDMPNVDVVEFEKNEKKYLPFFDSAYAKVKPHVYDSKVLKEELRESAVDTVRRMLVNEIKPDKATLTPQFEKTLINKDTATVKGSVTLKASGTGGKTYNRSCNCQVHLEYYNEQWVVVGMLLEDEL